MALRFARPDDPPPAVPARLRPGDTIRFVSPASPPDRQVVEARARIFEGWGLAVTYGDHAFDRLAYLAGSDAARLADIDAAFRDPTVRAVVATRGGKGSYRIADRLDFAAAARDPKPLVGFSDITALHLCLWDRVRLPGVHGALTADIGGAVNAQSAAALRQVLMTPDDIVIGSRHDEETVVLTTSGTASGPLVGGNLTMLATTAGWGLPDLRGCILLIEAVDVFLGAIDRMLTMLIKSGRFAGVNGIAVGQFTGIPDSGPWCVTDLLRQHLFPLRIPVLGGLPLGHGPDPLCVPLGAEAFLDAGAGTLTVQSLYGGPGRDQPAEPLSHAAKSATSGLDIDPGG
ncbi:MAG: LD-carboxypeptidase [Pseudomonadota bacterium]